MVPVLIKGLKCSNNSQDKLRCEYLKNFFTYFQILVGHTKVVPSQRQNQNPTPQTLNPNIPCLIFGDLSTGRWAPQGLSSSNSVSFLWLLTQSIPEPGFPRCLQLIPMLLSLLSSLGLHCSFDFTSVTLFHYPVKGCFPQHDPAACCLAAKRSLKYLNYKSFLILSFWFIKRK